MVSTGNARAVSGVELGCRKTALCLALVLTWSSRLCHTHNATTEGHAVRGKPRLVREARLGSREAALCLGLRHARALQRPNALRAPAAPYKLSVAAHVTAWEPAKQRPSAGQLAVAL